MKNIAGKLVKIMGECAHVIKNGTNEYHKYRYVTAEDVVTKVNAALTKNGVCTVVMPALIRFDDVTNLKGNVEHLATVQVAIQLIDSVSGETVEILGIGSGQDAGDKAVMKAQTAAIKYAYMLSFAIATGDDPEADTKTDQFSASPNTKTQTKQEPKAAPDLVCVDCGVAVTDKVKEFAIKRYGQALCMKCQKVHGAVA